MARDARLRRRAGADIPSAARFARVRAALRNLPAFLTMVYRINPTGVAAIVACRVARAVEPFGLLWTGKLIIETIEASYGSSAPMEWRRLAVLLGLEFVIACTGQALARASALVERALGDRFADDLSVRLMRQTARLDLVQLEDPTTHDHLERARRQLTRRTVLLAQIFDAGQNAVTIAILASALALYVPWLLALLGVSVLPVFAGEMHFARLSHALLTRQAPKQRILDYLRRLATTDDSAKEIKLFQLSEHLAERFNALARELFDAAHSLARRRTASTVALSAVAAAGYYSAYAVVIYLTAIRYRSPAGVFTIGVLSFLAGSFRQSRDLLQALLQTVASIYEESLHVDDLLRYLRLTPAIRGCAARLAPPRPMRRGIAFEAVSFRYPASGAWAVRDLTFTIGAGEVVALVGENGAGKTTVVKLLTRLYDPDEGRILLDGVDLREYEIETLRQSMGVIFQDYLRYAFPFGDNIAVGQIDARHDQSRIRDAARRSLADQIADRLPRGFDQQLGRRFDGVDLSGGEWQKVALARAYMRTAQLLVLDEPTAALDARAEADVFQRFAELAAGRSAVLISHRLSTVRMAHRIIVLRQGRLVENGPHDALIQRSGLYAELYGMQAAAYR